MSEYHDSHVHLTNYIQEGPSALQFLDVMGDTVGRAVLCGIPLQQKWNYRISGADAPTYYLQTDASLYYYSFTDAAIAMTYLQLPEALRKRFDPMITGFNPADMYGVDHIRRVLLTFPGVFSGIGEFTIHKEFVSSKLAAEVPSLSDPALDRILTFAGEVGLVALIHCDMDTPFPKPGAKPTFLSRMRAMLQRHPNTKIIWAHMGIGRIVTPVPDHLGVLEDILSNPQFDHVCFDISWDEVAKYQDLTPTTVERAAKLLQRYPDRCLFGTDEVAPTDARTYRSVYELYRPVWDRIDPVTLHKVSKGNYERLFDDARRRVRAWERHQLAVREVPEAEGAPMLH